LNRLCLHSALWLLVLYGAAWGQGREVDPRRWGTATINPYGETFELDYVSPALHKWYEPRYMPETYMSPWYAQQTNYASEDYARYLSRLLEGEEAYDTFGNPLGRGWLVYSWMQEQPGPRGSVVDKNLGGLSSLRLQGDQRPAYRDFFSRLVIASDQRGTGAYRLMIGDEIFTRFTPLTFYKPRFNGVRLDYAAERYSSTVLLSRPSNPDEEAQTNSTTLMGGHAEMQLGTQSTLGLTYVNAHNVLTQVEFDEGNPLHGILTALQNKPLDKLWVRVRDDSPGRGTVGAALAGFDIVMIDTSGRELRGRDIGFLPTVEGGVVQGGRLFARDEESILLEYDLGSFDFEDIQSDDLRQVYVELSVANDYRIEMASDLQTDGQTRNAEIVFLPVERSGGNVQDNSNTRVVRLDYGLPTASELIGVDWNLVDWGGLSLQGEFVLNRRFFRYPNPAISDHYERADLASAAYIDAQYRRGSWTLFAEAFSIEDDYSTSYWISNQSGRISYKNPIPQVYEFVDDDDDLNGLTEWQRPFFVNWGSDAAQRAGTIQSDRREIAWPGLDENGDFLNDYNQNGNLLPDYEEPFLRYRSDRPEFLFGLDMNHNGTIDRFENDILPDYPYKKDHSGYNAFVQIDIIPGLKWIGGRQDIRLLAGDGHARSHYYLATLVRSLGRGGRLRLVGHGARVHDDIPDDLRQWVQPLDAPGRMVEVRDFLPGLDAWNHTFYGDIEQRIGPGIRLFHRAKWDWTQQLETAEEARQREGRKTSFFVGLINKAEWSIPIGLGVLEPRWKSEYRRERPFSSRLPASESIEQLGILMWTQPLMAESVGVSYFPKYGRQLFSTELQVGIEAGRLWLLEGTRTGAETDATSWTGVVQLRNQTAYQGYQIVTRTGAQLQRRNLKGAASQEASTVFMSVTAGLNQ
jgi:hypothetical protein